MNQDEIKLHLDVEKDNYETYGKAANLLLIANSAGMAACLTVLKEPDTKGIYKGIGLLLVLFGIGLLIPLDVAHHSGMISPTVPI